MKSQLSTMKIITYLNEINENANVINSEFRSINRKGKINIRTQKKREQISNLTFCGLYGL